MYLLFSCPAAVPLCYPENPTDWFLDWYPAASAWLDHDQRPSHKTAFGEYQTERRMGCEEHWISQLCSKQHLWPAFGLKYNKCSTPKTSALSHSVLKAVSKVSPPEHTLVSFTTLRSKSFEEYNIWTIQKIPETFDTSWKVTQNTWMPWLCKVYISKKIPCSLLLYN